MISCEAARLRRQFSTDDYDEDFSEESNIDDQFENEFSQQTNNGFQPNQGNFNSQTFNTQPTFAPTPPPPAASSPPPTLAPAVQSCIETCARNEILLIIQMA